MALAAAAPPQAMPDADLPIHKVRLRDLTNTARFRELDRLEAYYRCRQYDGLRYDWDGNFRGYGGEADIKPGWFVPLKRRRPDTRMELAKTIVGRFTALLFGLDRWPEIRVEGDELAEDYARALVRASKLPTKMIEARNLGGAEGTSCLSFAYWKGRPRVQVHNAKNCTVLAWAEAEDYVVGAVIEAYPYKRPVWENGIAKMRDYYYARYWDRFREVIWAPIPKAIGDQPGWSRAVRFKEVTHGYGFTPFYWIQNLPDSYDSDGESDYEGLCDAIDSINRLLSATGKGTVANVDPTLVVKMEPALNDGNVRKGSGQALFSPGGAEYLEIKGDAVRAAVELLKVKRAAVLEAAQCVVLDPDEGTAGVVSGEALRLRYAPMLAKADLLREQYGGALTALIRDMLRAARKIEASPPGPVVMVAGQPVQPQPSIKLPQRIERVKEKDPETGETKHRDLKRKRRPGTAEDIDLLWGPYFPHTWTDIEKGVNAAMKASGGKPVASHRTGIQMVASMTGVEDPDAELRQIDEDSEVATERATRAFGGGPAVPPAKPVAGPPQPKEAPEAKAPKPSED